MLRKLLNKKMKKRFIKMYSEVAENFDPADLPPEEAWKNDLHAIADGMYDTQPKDVTEINEVLGYMMLAGFDAELSAEVMTKEQGTVDMVVPETLADLISQTNGVVTGMGGFNPSKINMMSKKEVN